jgi:hypothetical protein
MLTTPYFNLSTQPNKYIKNLNADKKKVVLKMKENEEDATAPTIPGKIILTKTEIKDKEKLLKSLSEKWKKERIEKEDFDKKTFGFTKNSEILNGRAAMFFFVTGILTEIWTKESIPGQIEIMIRTFGII